MRHIVVAIAVLVFARTASAHALDIAYLRVEPASGSDAMQIVFDLDRAAVAQLLGVDEVSLGTARARSGELASMTYAREVPTTSAGPCQLAVPDVELIGASVRFTATMTCPDSQSTWRFPFVTEGRVAASFQLLVKHGEQLDIVERNAPMVAFGHARASLPRVPHNRSMFLIGALLVGVLLAPLARIALRR